MNHEQLINVLLFCGNAVLFYLWSVALLRQVRGRCPHCGE